MLVGGPESQRRERRETATARGQRHRDERREATSGRATERQRTEKRRRHEEVKRRRYEGRGQRPRTQSEGTNGAADGWGKQRSGRKERRATERGVWRPDDHERRCSRQRTGATRIRIHWKRDAEKKNDQGRSGRRDGGTERRKAREAARWCGEKGGRWMGHKVRVLSRGGQNRRRRLLDSSLSGGLRSPVGRRGGGRRGPKGGGKERPRRRIRRNGMNGHAESAMSYVALRSGGRACSREV